MTELNLSKIVFHILLASGKLDDFKISFHSSYTNVKIIVLHRGIVKFT